MSRSETKTERSEVVKSLTRTAQLSGDGRLRLCGCLTFHGEQKTTQLAAWGMLAWPEASYLVSLVSLKSYRSILKRTLDVNLVFIYLGWDQSSKNLQTGSSQLSPRSGSNGSREI